VLVGDRHVHDNDTAGAGDISTSTCHLLNTRQVISLRDGVDRYLSIFTITESEIGDCHGLAVHKRMQSIA
jgi:hypothetical protein